MIRRLRTAMLKFAALALLGAAAAASGLHEAALEHDVHERLLAERRSIGARLAGADADVAELAARAEHYRQLESRGRLGPERRLDWIELVAAVRDMRQLFDMDYEFAAQRPLEATPAGAEFVASTMRLHMPLLHEGDLIAFLGDLAERSPALLRVRECRLERVATEQRTPGPAARLTASCRIDWITLRTPA